VSKPAGIEGPFEKYLSPFLLILLAAKALGDETSEVSEDFGSLLQQKAPPSGRLP